MTLENTSQFRIHSGDVSNVYVSGDEPCSSEACRQNITSRRQAIIADKVNLLFQLHPDQCAAMQAQMQGQENILARFEFKVLTYETLQISRDGRVVGEFTDRRVVKELIDEVKAVRCHCPKHGVHAPVPTTLPERITPPEDSAAEGLNPHQIHTLSRVEYTDQYPMPLPAVAQFFAHIHEDTPQAYEVRQVQNPQRASTEEIFSVPMHAELKSAPAQLIESVRRQPAHRDLTRLQDAQKRLTEALQQLVEASKLSQTEPTEELKAEISPRRIPDSTAKQPEDLYKLAGELVQAMKGLIPDDSSVVTTPNLSEEEENEILAFVDSWLETGSIEDGLLQNEALTPKQTVLSTEDQPLVDAARVFEESASNKEDVPQTPVAILSEEEQALANAAKDLEESMRTLYPEYAIETSANAADIRRIEESMRKQEEEFKEFFQDSSSEEEIDDIIARQMPAFQAKQVERRLRSSPF